MATTRGTTPEHIFKTDIDLSDAEVIYITYKQGKDVVVEKEKDDLTLSPDAIKVKLSQDETLRFKKNLDVRVQIRVRFADETALASNIIETTAGEILKEGVI